MSSCKGGGLGGFIGGFGIKLEENVDPVVDLYLEWVEERGEETGLLRCDSIWLDSYFFYLLNLPARALNFILAKMVEAAHFNPLFFTIYFNFYPPGKNYSKTSRKTGFYLFTRIKVSRKGGGYLNLGSFNLSKAYFWAVSLGVGAGEGVFVF